MERYRRLDVAEQPSADPRRNRNKYLGSAAHHNYYSNAEGGAGGGGSLPPDISSRVDSSRQYIPMSQKGTRPIQYSGARGGSRALHPAMAMKLMYNQPSHAGGFANNAGAGYHVHGGGASRPSWWG